LRAAAGYSAAGAMNHPRHCEGASDEAIHTFFAAPWIASLRSQ
jgi:hypothetical protein